MCDYFARLLVCEIDGKLGARETLFSLDFVVDIYVRERLA